MGFGFRESFGLQGQGFRVWRGGFGSVRGRELGSRVSGGLGSWVP